MKKLYYNINNYTSLCFWRCFIEDLNTVGICGHFSVTLEFLHIPQYILSPLLHHLLCKLRHISEPTVAPLVEKFAQPYIS